MFININTMFINFVVRKKFVLIESNSGSASGQFSSLIYFMEKLFTNVSETDYSTAVHA